MEINLSIISAVNRDRGFISSRIAKLYLAYLYHWFSPILLSPRLTQNYAAEEPLVKRSIFNAPKPFGRVFTLPTNVVGAFFEKYWLVRVMFTQMLKCCRFIYNKQAIHN